MTDQPTIPTDDGKMEIIQNPVSLIPYSDIEKMAQAIVKGNLFGIDKPEQALSLMLLCQAKGIHPMLAVERYHIIQGKPAMKAEQMLAEFLSVGGHVEWKERNDKACEAKFEHPNGGTVTVRWTIQDAQKAELAGKANWKKFPRQMLHARVVSEGVRSVAPGCVLGTYTPEEIYDFESPAFPVKAPMTELAVKNVETDEKELEASLDTDAPFKNPPQVVIPYEKKPEMCTPAQQKEILSLFANDKGAVKQTLIARFKVDSFKDLSFEIAKALIDDPFTGAKIP